MARKKDTKNVNSEKNAEAEVTTATAAAEEEAKVEVITEEATQAEAPKKGGARKPKTLKEKSPLPRKSLARVQRTRKLTKLPLWKRKRLMRQKPCQRRRNAAVASL